MNQNTWKKIETIFKAAVELPVDKQESFVAEACQGNAALQNEIMQLLNADGNPHSMLDGHALDGIELTPETLPSGTQIENYRIIELIGTGGMGTVYLAERSDGEFKQQVALKLIKNGRNNREVLSRFRNERQILARLEHPNIARLLDGGVTKNGDPYFTMEYVDGEPIHFYCDRHKLSIEDRLSLFIEVCEAVRYAHRNLVIHRDLKPGNILVTSSGEVKLLDFGIAKFLESDDAIMQTITQAGLMAMTPEYASPEQIRGEAVTTASDIYSLGVILSLLLSGNPPYRLNSRSVAALVDAVCHTDPLKPSTGLFLKNTSTEKPTTSPENTAQLRRLSIVKLKQMLSGDLDNICLKALRKEPERRYQYIDEFINDLRNYLDDKPVSASGDAFQYRAGKFIRRHRFAVISSALTLLVLATLISFYTIRLAEERDRARLEAQKASQITEFLTSIFAISDPNESRGEAVTARELLDEGAKRLDQELAAQPAVQAALSEVIGRVYNNLGLYERARPLLEKSLALRNNEAAADIAGTGRSMQALGEYHHMLGNFSVAESLYIAAIDIQRTLGASHTNDYVTTLNFLGWLKNDLGEYDAAEAWYNKGLMVMEENGELESVSYATTINNVALLLHERNDYDPAEKLFRKGIEILRRVVGEDHQETSTTYYNLGQLLRDKGDFLTADSMLRQSLYIDQKLLGDNHPTLAYTFTSIAQLSEIMGRIDSSEALHRRALKIRRTSLGAEHPKVAYSLTHLAGTLGRQEKFTEAEACFQEAESIIAKVYGETHPEYIKLVYYQGMLLQRKGDFRSAEALLVRAVALRSKTFGKGHRLTGNALMALASVYHDQQKWVKSDSTYLVVAHLFSNLFGESHPAVAESYTQRGLIAGDLSNYPLADSLLNKGINLFRSSIKEDNPRLWKGLQTYGKFCLNRGELKKAELLLQEAYNLQKQHRGETHEDTRETAKLLAKLYQKSGNAEKAKRIRNSQN